MVTTFNFTQADATVQQYLNATERGNVTAWQTDYSYSLEFHAGHTTGDPIYFRPGGNKDKSNIPKIDTKNKQASDYKTLQHIANWGKLQGGLKKAAYDEIVQIIANSWGSLQLLASRFWSGTSAPPVPVVPTQKDCVHCKAVGSVPIVTSGKASCTKCFKYS